MFINITCYSDVYANWYKYEENLLHGFIYMFTRLKQFTNNQNNNIVASDL